MAEQWYFALPFLCTDFQEFSSIFKDFNRTEQFSNKILLKPIYFLALLNYISRKVSF